MAYGDFKDLNGRTAAVKYYVIKHLMLLKIQNMIDINVDLVQWSINFMIATAIANKSAVKNEIISNKDLVKELHKPLINDLDFRYVLFRCIYIHI